MPFPGLESRLGALARRARTSPRKTVAIACFAIAVAAAFAAAVKLNWTARVIFYSAAGRIPDMDWGETMHVVRAGQAFDLKKLAQSRNPYGALENPHRAEEDVAKGGALFAANCAACHGAAAQGHDAPALVGRVLTTGDSDWSLYRTISRGIPDRGMPALPLSPRERWQTVAFLRSVDADRPAPKAMAAITPVTPERLLAARESPEEWLTYSGAYDGWRHSALAEIDRTNVGRLKVAWIHQFVDGNPRFETTPLVVDGVMFLTGSQNQVAALNAATGEEYWTFRRPLARKLSLCCGRVNRGLAILGDTLFLATLDAHLIALDAATGAVKWETEVADSAKGYSFTLAPLAVKDLVIVGTSGGEFKTRGFVAAYDAKTGERRWTFRTIPDKDEPGGETWGKGAERLGGPAWMTGSYDPALDLLYWGVGNPNPDFDGEKRPGDNLYTNSLVALDPDSGEMRWWFQFTPHDVHDRAASQIPVLVDDPAGRRLVLNANKNGFFYRLDRETGAFIGGAPFVRQTWTEGLDQTGRPIVAKGSAPSETGALVYPGAAGGANWWPPTYSPETRLLYVVAATGGDVFVRGGDDAVHRMAMGGGAQSRDSGAAVLIALDPAAGAARWRTTLAETIPPYPYYIGGALSTGGGLVFSGAEDLFQALNDETGEILWRFRGGRGVHSAPISYAAGGRQFIAVPIGRALVAFSLGD